MRLSWGEIRSRAKAFAEEWKNAHYERGETQSFYNDFFDIFGVKRRQVAIYEKRVEMIDRNKRGFIDLFWPGTLIIEQKSAGRDLLAAQSQAFDYFEGLREADQPKYIEAFAFILGRRRSFGTQPEAMVNPLEREGVKQNRRIASRKARDSEMQEAS